MNGEKEERKNKKEQQKEDEEEQDIFQEEVDSTLVQTDVHIQSLLVTHNPL